MDKLEVILEKIKNLNMKKEIEDHILYKIDSIKSHILDVITYSKTYDEIKDNVPFPAFFDSDNGILYAYQTRHNNKPAFFVLVWKFTVPIGAKLLFHIYFAAHLMPLRHIPASDPSALKNRIKKS